jgi:hypothetical protein
MFSISVVGLLSRLWPFTLGIDLFWSLLVDTHNCSLDGVDRVPKITVMVVPNPEYDFLLNFGNGR